MGTLPDHGARPAASQACARLPTSGGAPLLILYRWMARARWGSLRRRERWVAAAKVRELDKLRMTSSQAPLPWPAGEAASGDGAAS